MTDLPLPRRDGHEVELVSRTPADESAFSRRTRERVRALDVVFEADQRNLAVGTVLAERRHTGARQTPLPEFAVLLAGLVDDHRRQVDEQIATYSEWPMERMPAVDRAILRTGGAELLWGSADTPTATVITEWVKIASARSTADSPRFVNALLQRLVDVRDLLA